MPFILRPYFDLADFASPCRDLLPPYSLSLVLPLSKSALIECNPRCVCAFKHSNKRQTAQRSEQQCEAKNQRTTKIERKFYRGLIRENAPTNSHTVLF